MAALPVGRLSGPAPALLTSRTAAEVLVALLLFSLVGAGAVPAWQTYQTRLLPLRVAPSVPPARPIGVRLDDRVAVERHQRVKDLLGEADAFRAARRLDWAEAALATALELEPQNPEARAMRANWDANPAPPLSPDEVAAWDRYLYLVDLLGAAISTMEAEGHSPQARTYLMEALALDPGNATALELLSRFPAG